jgi:TonB family protein
MKALLVLLAVHSMAVPAAADQPSDSKPTINLPHNCIGNYPEAAVKADAEGTTLVTFTIAADGSVKDPKIAKSSGNADLDAASLQCVSGWQYVPAGRGGAAVEAAWQANVQWKMHGGTDYRLMAHCARFHALTAGMFSGISGLTVLTYRVMPTGLLSDIAVAKSSGDKSLDDAALTCLHDIHYNNEDLDIPQSGIPGHALIDWDSEFQRGSRPLEQPFPQGLAPPTLLPGPSCEAMDRARRPEHDGETALKFTIATDGSVRDIAVTQSSGTAALDEATKTCVAGWHFIAANTGGVPYAVKWSLRVLWRAGQPPAEMLQL